MARVQKTEYFYILIILYYYFYRPRLPCRSVKDYIYDYSLLTFYALCDIGRFIMLPLQKKNRVFKTMFQL